MPETLTREVLEDYARQIKEGSLTVDEFKAGLIAIYGCRTVEVESPQDFLDFLGVPLEEIDMDDELRLEWSAKGS